VADIFGGERREGGVSFKDAFVSGASCCFSSTVTMQSLTSGTVEDKHVTSGLVVVALNQSHQICYMLGLRSQRVLNLAKSDPGSRIAFSSAFSDSGSSLTRAISMSL
jgi:hypothetical protein